MADAAAIGLVAQRHEKGLTNLTTGKGNQAVDVRLAQRRLSISFCSSWRRLTGVLVPFP